MTKEFSFYVPGEILFGKGILDKLPLLLEQKEINKILIILDPNLAKEGLADKLKNLFASSTIDYHLFTEVEADPSTDVVENGLEVFNKYELDGVACIGGGSTIDIAKSVAVVASNGGKIQDFEGAHKVERQNIPVIAVPTTAGTGSEVTPFIVITDKNRNYKLTVFSYKSIPSIALLDPDLIMSVPPFVAATTGMDALTHAIEAYLSLGSSIFSDMNAEKAMELIGKYIKPFVANRKNAEAASSMLLGSMFSGIAFSWARLGNIHAMAHPLGGFFNIPHGVANSVLLPNILEFNALADQGKYEKIYKFIKGSEYTEFSPLMLVDEIRGLLKELGIPENLSALKVDESLIPRMASDAMKSGNVLVNPRQTTVKDIENLYLRSM